MPDPILLHAVPYAKHPIVDASWDASAATSRLRTWASKDGSGDKDTIDWSKYSQGFAWVDPAQREDFGGYKLPHHDVRDGQLVTVRAGVSAALAALHGARGGVAIPEADKAAVESHLARHAKDAETATKSDVRCPGVALLTAAEPLARSWVQIAKVGEFKGHPAGPFALTPDVFDAITKNFRATANQRVPVDYEHTSETLPEGTAQSGVPAAAWVVDLDNRGASGLWALFEWVDAQAVAYVREGRYRYVSPAIVFHALDRESGEDIGPRLTSVALTNHPFLDGMEPLKARADGATRASLTPDAVHLPTSISVERKPMEEMLKKMRALMKLGADATEADVMAAVEKMCGDHAAMSAEREARLMSEARADVEARCASLPNAGKDAALKIRLSDRTGFEAMFPMPAPKPVVAAPAAVVMSTPLTAPPAPQWSQPASPAAAPIAASDHSYLASERAEKLLSARPSLSYSQALVEASRQINQEQRDAALKALGIGGAQ